ncbi:MAG: GNAT family N-acetyltransferase [Clostridia bacterium]|nr:GNAT family N-acetyltransferase [Clostridia bacterium]
MREHALKDGRVLRLRPPRLEDAGLLVEFPKKIGAETDFLLCDKNGIPGLDIEGERAYIQSTLDAPNTAMFLGFIEDELAALCDVRAEGRPRVAHNAQLSVAVLEKYWHIGVGSILMETMIDFARATGVLENLWLDLRADNRRALALYERFGFQAAGRLSRRIRVRGEYYDALIMELAL